MFTCQNTWLRGNWFLLDWQISDHPTGSCQTPLPLQIWSQEGTYVSLPTQHGSSAFAALSHQGSGSGSERLCLKEELCSLCWVSLRPRLPGPPLALQGPGCSSQSSQVPHHTQCCFSEMALLWINVVGEGKQDQERRTEDIFENYTARSSPGNNFSFVCIDLQNKQRGEGRERWKTVSTVKEIHLLLHSRQIKRSQSQAGRASPRGRKVGAMEEQLEASPKPNSSFPDQPWRPPLGSHWVRNLCLHLHTLSLFF